MMTTVVPHIEEEIEYPQHQQAHRKDAGTVHVVYLKVIGLSGIILDSQKTKATVSKSKDMLLPPRLMKASLAVVRDNQIYGVSPDSKRLSRIIPTQSSPAADEIMTAQQQVDRQLSFPLKPPPTGQRPARRYIAVWDNSTIKATATATGEVAASTADSTILFETTLISNTAEVGAVATPDASDDNAIKLSPHKNFELIVGLVSPVTGASPKSGMTTMTIPMGVASLPINEAAALRGSSGKVVLDLPIFNISTVHNNITNPFVENNNIIEDETTRGEKKSKRNIFSVLKRRKNPHNSSSNTATSNKLKQPCVYTLDTSTNDAATLRIELELHEKESNVEMGLLFSDELYSIVTNRSDPDKENEEKDVILTEEVTDDMNNQSIETSTHSNETPNENSADDNHDEETIQLEQPIERVLSIRSTPSILKSRLKFSPVRRFRVKCSDNDTSKIELTPVSPSVQKQEQTQVNNIETIQQEKLLKPVEEDECDIKSRLLDVTIERVLSTKESDDVIIPDQFDPDEDDVPLNKNDIPFDEQSFLSRNTEAILPRKRSFVKQQIAYDEQSKVKPPRLNLNLVPRNKTSKFGSFWGRGRKWNVTNNSFTSAPSISGTESSTHSILNADGEIDNRPIHVGIVKKVLLPNTNNINQSLLIDVPPSNYEYVHEEPTTTSKINDEESIPVIPESKPMVKPVSILRKSINSGTALPKDLPSISTFDTPRILLKVESKADAFSVVSSSAETEVMKKNNTKPPVDYEDHFNMIIKELSDDKTPVSDGPDTDATESIQSSTTNATPTSPDDSAYSSSLPSFVEEPNPPATWEEKIPFNDDGIVVKKAPKKKPADITKLEVPIVVSTQPFDKPQVNRTVPPKKNLFAQKLHGLFDIQPCAGKLDQFLVPHDEEIMSIDESWINENSTIDTYKAQRKETIHDDLDDLGLLWGDMCRQTGCRSNDDDSFLLNESITREKSRTKQRWMEGLRKSRNSRKRYEYDEIDEGDHSVSSDLSGGSFTDENTLRSTTEESESGFSEQGTEIDVTDVDVAADNSPPTRLNNKQGMAPFVKSPLMRQLGGTGSRFVSSNKAVMVMDDNTLESTSDVPSLSGLSARLSNRWSKNNVDQKTIGKTVPVASSATYNATLLPPKTRKAKTNVQAPAAVSETAPVRPNVPEGSFTCGSNTDSATPLNYVPPKSITQSLVDFVEYVISPSPTPSAMLIPNVPTVLNTDDEASVGELTATTYERQVEVDEMRRISEIQQQFKPTIAEISSDRTNFENYNSDDELIPIATVTVDNDTFFTEYSGNDNGIISPEVSAAMEAAAAKQLAV